MGIIKMLPIIRYLFASLCLCLITTSHAKEGVYTVTYVYDGDTVKLRPINSNSQKDEFKLRLTDIDAPERTQDYGLKSRRALIKLCQGELSPSKGKKAVQLGVQDKKILVTAEIIAKDKYNRALGRLQCNHIDASLYLVELGLAWYPNKYSNDREIYHAALKARTKKRGLWTDDKPIPPWSWRREHLH